MANSCCHRTFPQYLKLHFIVFIYVCLLSILVKRKSSGLGRRFAELVAICLLPSLQKRCPPPSFRIWNFPWPCLRHHSLQDPDPLPSTAPTLPMARDAVWAPWALSLCPSSSAGASLPSSTPQLPTLSCPQAHGSASAPSPGRAQCPRRGCPCLGRWDGAWCQALPCCTQEPWPPTAAPHPKQHPKTRTIDTAQNLSRAASLGVYLEPVSSNFCLWIETCSLV